MRKISMRIALDLFRGHCSLYYFSMKRQYFSLSRCFVEYTQMCEQMMLELSSLPPPSLMDRGNAKHVEVCRPAPWMQLCV